MVLLCGFYGLFIICAFYVVFDNVTFEMGEERTEFQKWIDTAELAPDTVQVLADNGFGSVKAVSKLTSALIQKHFHKALPLGQFLLLESAVDSLRQDGGADKCSSDNHSQGSVINEPLASPETGGAGPSTRHQHHQRQQQQQHAEPQAAANTGPRDMQLPAEGVNIANLCQLFGVNSAPELEVQNHNAAGKHQTFDPFQCYEGSSVAGSGKSKDIRDYMLFKKNGQSGNDEPSTFKVGDVDVTIAGAGRKQPLDKVSPMQYMEANMRILREMIMSEKVDMTTVLQYIGYLTKVSCMSQVFQWNLLLKYDSEYRRQQSTLGFPWGADSPFLLHLFLGQEATSRQKPQPEAGHASSRNVYDPKSGKIICEKYNGRNGCNFRGCKYAHICKSCYSTSHGEVTHKQNNPSSTATPTSQPSGEPVSKNG